MRGVFLVCTISQNDIESSEVPWLFVVCSTCSYQIVFDETVIDVDISEDACTACQAPLLGGLNLVKIQIRDAFDGITNIVGCVGGCDSGVVLLISARGSVEAPPDGNESAISQSSRVAVTRPAAPTSTVENVSSRVPQEPVPVPVRVFRFPAERPLTRS